MQSLPLPLLLQSSPSPHLMLHDSQLWKIFNLCCAVCKVLLMNRFVCRALSTAVGVLSILNQNIGTAVDVSSRTAFGCRS
jgi:hypothetical protein